MISNKQHEANIRNAQHSTGPVTPEGKEKVRFNALKHGLRARSFLLPSENQADFDELYATYAEEWKPREERERALVEQMVLHQWLLVRYARFEACHLNVESYDLMQSLVILRHLAALRTTSERACSKTMHDLLRLQKIRPSAPVPETPAPEPRHPQPNPEPPLEDPDPGHVYAPAPDTQ